MMTYRFKVLLVGLAGLVVFGLCVMTALRIRMAATDPPERCIERMVAALTTGLANPNVDNTVHKAVLLCRAVHQ